MGERVLVTGGAGFIGSHLSEALRARGLEVRVLDNLSVGDANVALLQKQGVEVRVGDIRDYETVRGAVEGCESVFHLAAMNRAQRSIQNPLEANAVNVDGTLNLLQASREAGVQRFVFASSSSVYGGGEEPCVENKPLVPSHPYGVSKLAAEEYCRVFNSLYGLRTVSLRYVSVYGPRQRGDIDYAAVIPKFAAAVLEGRKPTVYGDGTQTRQFTFVTDNVAGTLAAWGNPAAYGQAFNIASPEETSVNEIAQLLQALAGKQTGVEYVPPLQGEPHRNPIDVSKAEKLLGFRAATPFKDGVRQLFEWVRSNRGEKQ